MIEILIADDHPVVRYGVKHMLGKHKHLKIVGEAENIEETLKLIGELAPDVVVLDMEMGECRGVQALEKVRASAPQTKVIVYTAYDNTNRIVEATGLGVQGYLLKDSGSNDLAKAIVTVAEGGIYFEANVAAKLVKGIHAAPAAPVDPLTPRELEVLRRMSRGFRNQAIADALFISERTAKYHVSAILAKLGAANRTEAVSMAMELGLLSDEDGGAPDGEPLAYASRH